MRDPRGVTLSLISHTNVGKTTLARTLLRREVGEVADRAHVTDASEAHVLIESDGRRLLLWDTPGFGDLTRLMRRLRNEREPLGWLLHQVWDRFVDRPLWCSQEAARNVREHADVVLYLVNAAESPHDAGYVLPELELLTWLDRPVLLLLNQVGDAAAHDREADWRALCSEWTIVRDVLRLDAFTRCWVEESVVLRRVADLLGDERRQTMLQLVEAWEHRQVEVFERAARSVADYVARAAADAEAAGTADGASRGTLAALGGALKRAALDERRARARLDERLDAATADLMRRLIDEHGLVGESALRIEERIREFQVRGGRLFDERTGALAGAVVSGALGGLAADALAGGLTLGGGMIAGGILGALGGSAIARGYRWAGGDSEPTVRWSREFLGRLLRQALLRYLAVAHYGRGRGRYRDLDRPGRWGVAVEAACEAAAPELRSVWKAAEREPAPEAREVALPLEPIVKRILRRVLRDAYPSARIPF